MPKIYTKRGDKGQTGLCPGRRVEKSDDIFKVLALTDRVNVELGNVITCIIEHRREMGMDIPIEINIEHKSNVIRPYVPNEIINLRKIQENILDIASYIAGYKSEDMKTEIKNLENNIDSYTASLSVLKTFILMGGNGKVSLAIDRARVTVRDLELEMWRYHDGLEQTFNPSMHVYINRLSDFLFQYSRYWATMYKKKEKYLTEKELRNERFKSIAMIVMFSVFLAYNIIYSK